MPIVSQTGLLPNLPSGPRNAFSAYLKIALESVEFRRTRHRRAPPAAAMFQFAASRAKMEGAYQRIQSIQEITIRTEDVSAAKALHRGVLCLPLLFEDAGSALE